MWIVLGEENGKIKLVSKSPAIGILPKGAFLTIEDENVKHILRVDDSRQNEPYAPSPLLADMDLSPLKPDQKCQNVLYAYRIGEIGKETENYISFIYPQSLARLSNQEEIDTVLKSSSEGPPVFLATVYSGSNKILCDENGNLIKAFLPIEMFFHQILICGKTGSGKTVASKYLAQFFVEELKKYGAVLAVNVKDIDLLTMDRPSKSVNSSILKEWESLKKEPHGIDNYTIYYPASTQIDVKTKVNREICRPITLNVKTLDPDALSGLLVHMISDIAGQHLPNIFRWWQEERRRGRGEFTFNDFVQHFENGINDGYVYNTLNSRGQELTVTLPWGTYQNVLRSLGTAMDFFDDPQAQTIEPKDILVRGKMSVINVADSKGIMFGSVILRHLLKGIVEEKATGRSETPILLIIDEVHQFYDTTSSREALGQLDTICRTGRNKEIGVIFSSQNPTDIPKGLASVINTTIFFKSDKTLSKNFGLSISSEEIQNLEKGFAVVNIHGLSQVKVIKFPLSLAGVFEKEAEKN